MKSDELREKYLRFFESKGHARQPSDVLVPTWDPSVLFTPAGMNQFKDHFLGKVKLEFTRAVTCQKCLRTGDIDNVGRTPYHHTFFEMLGNFSFGDYFKREAIAWAWEFLTDKKWLGLDPQRLNATVYLDDDEAAEIWQQDIGLPVSRVQRMGEGDNFWPAHAPSQGPDGVCGPCSEIFYRNDDGSEVEIWNLVFTQFQRVGDPPDNLRPLPSKNIDTGMGLERAAAVLQGVNSNYDIDILRPIVLAAAEVCELPYDRESDHGRRLRRISDHVRACTFAIHENVYPGPNKEKYVIRRLLRRAVLDGHQMGRREPFLFQLAPVVADMMKTAYPELLDTVERVQQVMRQEETSFLATLDSGLVRIERLFDKLQQQGLTVIPGDEAFDLYQTYGLPPELTETLGAERGLTFDWKGLEICIHGHPEPSAEGGGLFKRGPIESLKESVRESKFLGYEVTDASATVRGVVALPPDNNVKEGRLCRRQYDQVGPSRRAIVVLDQTPFYGESGGQVGDSGEIVGDDFVFVVTDTQRDGGLVLHLGYLKSGVLEIGSTAAARVDADRRQGIRRAHSATHILHYALQQKLGAHAQQQGSKVERDELRFDFTNLAPVDAEQLAQIEQQVARRIEAAEPIRWEVVPLAKAREAGAMMLFGEKYPDPVRMVSMGDFSKELCGGTHLDNTGEVEQFEIVAEEGVSSGTRRVVAVTGRRAAEQAEKTRQTLAAAARLLQCSEQDVPEAVKDWLQLVRGLKKRLAGGPAPPEPPSRKAGGQPLDYQQMKALLRDTARSLNVPLFETAERIEALQQETQSLREQVAQLDQAGRLSADSLLAEAESVQGVTVVIAEMPAGNPNLMRQLIDQIRQKTSPVAVLLAAGAGDKVQLVAGVSRELVDRGVHAGQWVGRAAKQVGGGGGGKADMAQAGGKQPDKLPQAFQEARQAIEEMLGP